MVFQEQRNGVAFYQTQFGKQLGRAVCIFNQLRVIYGLTSVSEYQGWAIRVALGKQAGVGNSGH